MPANTVVFWSCELKTRFNGNITLAAGYFVLGNPVGVKLTAEDPYTVIMIRKPTNGVDTIWNADKLYSVGGN